MKVYETLESRTRAIAHLSEEEKIAQMNGMRLPLYQVVLDPDPSLYSPSGDHIRFNHMSKEGEPVCELNGWFNVNSIVIDEVLEVEVDGEWVAPTKPIGCTIMTVKDEEDGRATGTE